MFFWKTHWAACSSAHPTWHLLFHRLLSIKYSVQIENVHKKKKQASVKVLFCLGTSRNTSQTLPDASPLTARHIPKWNSSSCSFHAWSRHPGQHLCCSRRIFLSSSPTSPSIRAVTCSTSQTRSSVVATLEKLASDIALSVFLYTNQTWENKFIHTHALQQHTHTHTDTLSLGIRLMSGGWAAAFGWSRLICSSSLARQPHCWWMGA